MPALVAPPTVTAVSSAPQSLPCAKVTCCMRESLLSRRSSLLFWREAAPIKRRQAASAMQSRRGRLVLTFWSERGGTPYFATVTALALSTGAATALLTERVFDTVQTTRSVEVPSLLKTASELSRYSVPCPSSSKSSLPEGCEGHTVKPATADTSAS